MKEKFFSDLKPQKWQPWVIYTQDDLERNRKRLLWQLRLVVGGFLLEVFTLAQVLSEISTKGLDKRLSVNVLLVLLIFAGLCWSLWSSKKDWKRFLKIQAIMQK
ncbi:MAG TPA: hypothetical protein VFM02_02605 [Candidatus Paceibacterota bacterium]|nr:hypothetical protein [Candidatus Paceibacterota bacterium]